MLDLRDLRSVLAVLKVSRSRKTSSLSRNLGLVSDLELGEEERATWSALGLDDAEVR